MGKIEPGLAGVPETLLWTLYHRATEARRPDAVLADPLAVEVVDAIDYPFAQRFGRDVAARAQWQALRTRRFDDEIWRVDNGRVRWLGVDLPEVVRLRRRLLPAADRQRSVACSVLDPAWLAEVDPSRGVVICAQGLLMYLDRADVHRVIGTCAERFPGATLVFDAVLHWFSQRTLRGAMTSGGYAAPPMPWGIDARELETLRHLHPNIAQVRRLGLPRGRGVLFGYLMPALGALPRLRNLIPIWILRARFRP